MREDSYPTYQEYLERVGTGITTQKGNCPVTLLLRMIQGKWKAQILYQFCIHEKIRYGKLKQALPGITNAMLTNALRELVRDGLVVREQFMWNIPFPRWERICSPCFTLSWYGGLSMRTR